jgi:hypothetical protein
MLLSNVTFATVVFDFGPWADFANALAWQLDASTSHGAIVKACAEFLDSVVTFVGRDDAAQSIATFERDSDRLTHDMQLTLRGSVWTLLLLALLQEASGRERTLPGIRASVLWILAFLAAPDLFALGGFLGSALLLVWLVLRRLVSPARDRATAQTNPARSGARMPAAALAPDVTRHDVNWGAKTPASWDVFSISTRLRRA